MLKIQDNYRTKKLEIAGRIRARTPRRPVEENMMLDFLGPITDDELVNGEIRMWKHINALLPR